MPRKATLGRRTVLTAGIATAPILSAGEAAIASNPDAELIRNCARMVELEAEWRKSLPDADGNHPGHSDEYHRLLNAVTDTPARTDAGNRAKLAVALSFYEPELPEDSIVDGILWDAIRGLALPFGRPA